MNIKFSDIQEQNLPEVKAIYDWYILNTTATFHTEPIRHEELQEFIYFNHPLYRSYMIYADSKTAGYCLLTNYKKRQAYERTAEVTIYLKPEYCGKGIGKKALIHLEESARANGLKNLIGIISGDNEDSIKLFERRGFSKCAHFRNVGEKFNKVIDVVAYQKELL
jgi:L-amino acid N-acyltransferase YncA